MIASNLLVGLAVATAVTAKSLTSVWLPNFSWWDFPFTVLGSLIGSNDEATTVAVQCPSSLHHRSTYSDFCATVNVMTVTYGPETVAYNYDLTSTGTGGTLRQSEAMYCDLDTSVVTCTNVYTEDGFGFSYTDSGTIKFGNAATYSTHLLSITITATGTVSETAAVTESSTTGEKADAGASSTVARTTNAVVSTSSGSTTTISDTASGSRTGASTTETETELRATDGGSTPSELVISATQTGATSVSVRYSKIVLLTIFGVIMMLI